MFRLKLDELVNSGQLTGYEFHTVNAEGEVDKKSNDGRNVERLILRFPNGDNLVLETFCSGSSQNTFFV